MGNSFPDRLLYFLLQGYLYERIYILGKTIQIGGFTSCQIALLSVKSVLKTR